jgi:hypothetical protein
MKASTLNRVEAFFYCGCRNGMKDRKFPYRPAHVAIYISGFSPLIVQRKNRDLRPGNLSEIKKTTIPHSYRAHPLCSRGDWR